jgi:hypothetical protein
VQTFAPSADIVFTFRCLDRQRLGKQRIEAQQLIRALLGETSGWVRHPAVAMWQGHVSALQAYRDICIREWMRRGYQNSIEHHTEVHALTDPACLSYFRSSGPPPWWGDEAVHASHRSNLIRKDPSHYGQFGWTESADLPYIWPGASL